MPGAKWPSLESGRLSDSEPLCSEPSSVDGSVAKTAPHPPPTAAVFTAAGPTPLASTPALLAPSISAASAAALLLHTALSVSSPTAPCCPKSWGWCPGHGSCPLLVCKSQGIASAHSQSPPTSMPVLWGLSWSAASPVALPFQTALNVSNLMAPCPGPCKLVCNSQAPASPPSHSPPDPPPKAAVFTAPTPLASTTALPVPWVSMASPKELLAQAALVVSSPAASIPGACFQDPSQGSCPFVGGTQDLASPLSRSPPSPPP
mmetsp:Transcript_112847/g.319187  ORF Transcript_112847/g.319187 Transcript_112847/m.319187 type:complete len:261 (+) Transcript_112847:856-1638(+)